MINTILNKEKVLNMYKVLQNAYADKLVHLTDTGDITDAHVVGSYRIINAHLNRFKESIDVIEPMLLSTDNFIKDHKEILERINQL